MMLTLVHIGFDLMLLAIITITKIISINILDIILLLSASLIDLDHLFSKPVYDPKRSSFKTHFLHKNWIIVLMLSIALLFIRPVLFLGIGLISHLLLDYIHVKMHNLIENGSK